VLREIKKPNRGHAHRIFQCLVVAIRPLRVEELAEILAVDFDDADGMARLKPSWRWEDEEQGLLSLCSSLITIVDSDGSRVVQFSHFSVREFLTSRRLATSNQDVSRYHIALEPAHTTLAQTCLSILLRSDGNVIHDIKEISPLARYAARYWVNHAKFKNVSSYLRRAMENLFDLDKPFFAAWRDLCDIDTRSKFGMTFGLFCPFWIPKSDAAAPLYYAALCGFHDLAEHLIDKYPQQVIATGGYHVTALVAALAGQHFEVAELLIRHGARATMDIRGLIKRCPLHSAANYGQVEVVRFLLEHNVDVNSRDSNHWTPLHYVGHDSRARRGPDVPRRLADIARSLLKHGANVDARSTSCRTPLHVAARWGIVEVARVLVEHGANIHEKDNAGKTASQLALERGHHEIVKFL